VSLRAVLDAVVKKKVSSPRRESNSRTPIVQPVAEAGETNLHVGYFGFSSLNLQKKVLYFIPIWPPNTVYAK
jgi:hypothetical protein